VILWPSLFAAIGLFGVDIAISRAAAHERDLGAVTRTAVLLALCTAAATIALCYALLPWFLPDNQAHLLPVAMIFLAFIPLNHVGLSLIAVDQGSGNFKRFNVFRMLLYPANLLFIVVAWIAGSGSVLWFAVANLLASALVVALRLWLVSRDHKLWGPFFSLVRICKQSVRFGCARVVETLYLYADKALLLWLLNVRDLGLYMAAFAASSVVNSLATSSGMVTFTMAAHHAQGSGFGDLAKVFRAVVSVWLVLGGCLALGMPYLLPLVYGGDFRAAVDPAILLITGSALAGLSSLLEQTMRGQGRAFVGIEARLAGLAVMVPIGYLGSRAWGMNGICLAFIVAQGVSLAVLILRTRGHYRREFSFRALVPTLGDARAVADRVVQRLPASLAWGRSRAEEDERRDES